MAVGASGASAFSANGSSDQVYVTGLAANQRMSLITPGGRTLYTQRADSQGGLLFRNVPAGSGYRVRVFPHGAQSGPITVHPRPPRPGIPSIYNQTINQPTGTST